MSTRYEIQNYTYENILVYFRYNNQMVSYIIRPNNESEGIYSAWLTNSIIIAISESGYVWRIKDYMNNVYDTSYILNTCISIPNGTNGFMYTSLTPEFKLDMNRHSLWDIYNKVQQIC